MPDLAEVLTRIAREPAFVDRLITDPKAALCGHRLTAHELDIVAATVTAETEALAAVEPEVRRSALVELLTQMVVPEETASGATPDGTKTQP